MAPSGEPTPCLASTCRLLCFGCQQKLTRKPCVQLFSGPSHSLTQANIHHITQHTEHQQQQQVEDKMFHDAPMEAVEPGSVAVHHRRRPKRTGGGGGSSSSAEKPISEAQRITEEYQLPKVVDYILAYEAPIEGRNETKPLLKVALQFPDSLLDDVTGVVHRLTDLLHADPRFPAYQQRLVAFHAQQCQRKEIAPKAATVSAPRQRPTGRGAGGALSATAAPAGSALQNPNAPVNDTRIFVLADNTFGSCCPDEITAVHYDSDCIVHFGEACMSKSTRLPVLYVHPQFHLLAVAPSPTESKESEVNGDGSHRFSAGEVHLLANTIQRMAGAIARRKAAWNASHADASSSNGGGGVAPRLVVVGSQSSAPLLRLAQTALIKDNNTAEGTISSIPVDWCRVDDGACGHGVCGATVTAAAAAYEEDPSEEETRKEAGVGSENEWVVNGTRLPRLAFAKSRANSGGATPVQHFLFAGPSAASHPVHLYGVHQYNNFHYPEHARAYFEEDNDPDTDDHHAPMLIIADESFAVLRTDGESGEGGKSNDTTALSATATTEEACRYLSNVLQKERSSDSHSDNIDADEQQRRAPADGSSAQSARALLTIHRRLAQRSFNIEAIRASSAVGILVASLAIEGYYECTMLLHQLLRAYGKRSYILYVGHLNEFKLANFADTVDCFVVVACPNARHCHFPEKSDNYMKRVVAPAEVLLALTVDPNRVYDDSEGEEEEGEGNEKRAGGLQLYGMPGLYSTEFHCILEPLRNALKARKSAVAEAEQNGGNDGAQADGDARLRAQWEDSAALIGRAPVGGGVWAATGNTVQGALARLHEREFVGLDPQIGQTAVQASLIQGKHGIARGYATEREAQSKPHQ